MPQQAVAKAEALRGEGTAAFAGKEYTRALGAYDAALKLLPAGHALHADMAVKKAACYLLLDRWGRSFAGGGPQVWLRGRAPGSMAAPVQGVRHARAPCFGHARARSPQHPGHPPHLTPHRFKDAARECSAVIDLDATNAAALRHRARALEKQGLFKQALADIQAVNRGSAASDDSRAAEKRLKELLAGAWRAAGRARAAAQAARRAGLRATRAGRAAAPPPPPDTRSATAPPCPRTPAHTTQGGAPRSPTAARARRLRARAPPARRLRRPRPPGAASRPLSPR
jgi:hypothetical protein